MNVGVSDMAVLNFGQALVKQEWFQLFGPKSSVLKELCPWNMSRLLQGGQFTRIITQTFSTNHPPTRNIKKQRVNKMC